MSIRVSDLRKSSQPASFEWEGEVCNIKFRPGAVTAQMQMSAAGLAVVGDDPKRIVEYVGDFVQAMTDLIVEWDIVDDDGEPLPITTETIGSFSLPFLYAMFGAIMSAYNPNSKSVKASRGT